MFTLVDANMPTRTVIIDGLELTLYYLTEYSEGGGVTVLQDLARGREPSSYRMETYTRQLGHIRSKFSQLVSGCAADAIAEAPSSREEVHDYFAAACDGLNAAAPMPNFKFFTKKDPALKSGAETTYEDAADNVHLRSTEVVEGLKQFLLVDDVYARGATFCGMIQRVREVVPDAEFDLAVALFVDAKKAQQAKRELEHQKSAAHAIMLDMIGERADGDESK